MLNFRTLDVLHEIISITIVKDWKVDPQHSKILLKHSNLAKRVTAPATTGEATLVPDRERQDP